MTPDTRAGLRRTLLLTALSTGLSLAATAAARAWRRRRETASGWERSTDRVPPRQDPRPS